MLKFPLGKSSPPPDIPLREFFERLVDERDRQYDMRFRAAEIAVNAALAAQEKAVASAFEASEKAIVKAEIAQKDYNARSNEFRGQLDDQAKRLMPREETSALFKAMDEKMSLSQEASLRERSVHTDRIQSLERSLGEYVSRAELARILEAQASDRNAISERTSTLEKGAANLQGRIWAFTALAWFIVLAVSIGLHFLK